MIDSLLRTLRPCRETGLSQPAPLMITLVTDNICIKADSWILYLTGRRAPVSSAQPSSHKSAAKNHTHCKSGRRCSMPEDKQILQASSSHLASNSYGIPCHRSPHPHHSHWESPQDTPRLVQRRTEPAREKQSTSSYLRMGSYQDDC